MGRPRGLKFGMMTRKTQSLYFLSGGEGSPPEVNEKCNNESFMIKSNFLNPSPPSKVDPRIFQQKVSLSNFEAKIFCGPLFLKPYHPRCSVYHRYFLPKFTDSQFFWIQIFFVL